MSIKALFVDIGGVLITNNTPAIKEKYERDFGLKKELVSEIFKYLQTADRTEQETTAFLREKGVPRELWDQYCEELFDSEHRNEDLFRILMEAKESGRLIVYTTNNSSALEPIMENYEIKDLAGLIINSSQAKVTKPDDAFWQLAISETQKIDPTIKPSEILVIDDSEINCLSAERNGMKTLLYKDNRSNQELCELIEG